MDFLITLIRFPFGVAAILIVAIFWLAVWPLELTSGAICLPIAAIFMRRNEIKRVWVGHWPYNSLRRIPHDSKKIWAWIFAG